MQRAQKQLFRWKTAVSIKVRCLVSAEGSKSAISDGKQLQLFINGAVVYTKIRCLGSATG